MRKFNFKVVVDTQEQNIKFIEETINENKISLKENFDEPGGRFFVFEISSDQLYYYRSEINPFPHLNFSSNERSMEIVWRALEIINTFKEKPYLFERKIYDFSNYYFGDEEVIEDAVFFLDLNLKGTNVKKLKNIYCFGNLIVAESKVETLEGEIHVGWGLDARESKIKKIPSGAFFGASVWLSKRFEESEFEEIGDNVIVGGNLFLSGSKLSKIGKNLFVGSNIYFKETPLRKLPGDAIIRGKIFSFPPA